MKIYKDKQFLIFDFEDGKNVKYDFSTKTAIGKSGKPVKNLCSQLSGLTINELIEYCEDKQYGKFLDFVRRNGDYYGRGISNIGTVLKRVPHFARFEQIFSAGIDDIISSSDFSHTINEIPKALIKLCKEHDIGLTNNFLNFYKHNPDGYLLAYNLDYVSLEDKDILSALRSYEFKYNHDTNEHIYSSRFNILIDEYGYTAKALMNYIDYCKTFEAMESMDFLMKELLDYAQMMQKISPKFDKYPRHFLTTHRIACRNYNRLKEQFDEAEFQKRIKPEMEKTFGDYVFIYPKSTQEIKDEAVNQNNCVASYINRVLSGDCDILFLRKKESPNISLVTIEVKRDKIVQARRKFNYPVSKDEQIAINKWNSWYSEKLIEEN